MTTFAARALVVLAAAFAVAGCSETALEQYRDATENLAEARDSVSEQKAEVNRLRERIAELRGELEQAVESLEGQRADLDQARRAARQLATDAVLFHVIQSSFLDGDRFGQAVITVAVDNGVVTLTGTVPDKAAREAARKLAASQPGVEKVVLNLTVKSAPKG